MPKAPADETDEDDATESRLQKSVPTHESDEYNEAKTGILNKLVSRLDDEINKRDARHIAAEIPQKLKEHEDRENEKIKAQDAERGMLQAKLTELENKQRDLLSSLQKV